jgi:hypothetical protein
MRGRIATPLFLIAMPVVSINLVHLTSRYFDCIVFDPTHA